MSVLIFLPLDKNEIRNMSIWTWAILQFNSSNKWIDLKMFHINLWLCTVEQKSIIYARSINFTRFTFLDPGSLLIRNKSYWIHEGPSKSVQVSSCGIIYQPVWIWLWSSSNLPTMPHVVGCQQGMLAALTGEIPVLWLPCRLEEDKNIVNWVIF